MKVAQPVGGRTLVAGWFSFERMGATAGDLEARDVAVRWLNEAGRTCDVAQAAPIEGGVDWRTVDPGRYAELVFVCGPFYVRRRVVRHLPARVADLIVRAGPTLRRVGLDPLRRFGLELLVGRFAHARLVGLDVSVLGPPGVWQPFDLLVERDSSSTARPDISLAATAARVPVVALVLVGRQREYGRAGRHRSAEAAITAALDGLDVAVVRVDTRLDRPNQGGLRNPAQVEALIACADAVVTTRMHGLVMAIKHGVPALALDPVAGGGKVTRQAAALGWPHVHQSDGVIPAALRISLEFCLSEEGRELAANRRESALAQVERIREEFVRGLGGPPPGPRDPS
jgi:hypothetical protein